MPPAELRQTVTVHVGQPANQEQRGAEHHATAAGRAEVYERHEHEHQREGERQPSAPPVVEHEYEEREQHVKQEHHAEEPAHADYVELRVSGQQPEAQRHVGEHLAQGAGTRLRRKVYEAHQSEERQYAQVALAVERRRRYSARLYPPVVAAAERKPAHNHEQQREVREERYQVSRHIVGRRLHTDVRLHVHQHYAQGGVGAKPVERAVTLAVNIVLAFRGVINVLLHICFAFSLFAPALFRTSP